MFATPRRLCLLLLVMLLLGSCGSQGEPVPTIPPAEPTPTQIPASTPTEAAVSTVVPTQPPPDDEATATQTGATPQSEVVLTVPVTATLPAGATSQAGSSPAIPGLSEAGPWLVLRGEQGLWVANGDGSGPTAIEARNPIGPVPLAAGLSPSGQHLAFLAAAEGERYTGLTLELLTFPGGRVQTITPLTSPETEPQSEPGGEDWEVVRAIADVTSIAWSEDGSQLAFMGGHEGDSSDLYIYSHPGGQVTRLTDGPSQGIAPTWSPDGEAVVHAGVTTLGTGAGFAMAGVWAARTDGSAIQSLYDPSESGGEMWAGWADAQTVLAYSFDSACGPSRLRAVNIASGDIRSIWDGAFEHVAFDRESGTILLGINPNNTLCLNGESSGLVRLRLDEPTPEPLNPGEVRGLLWLPEAGQFVVQLLDGMLLVPPDGPPTTQIAPLVGDFAVAPDGRTIAWTGQEPAGVWVASVGQAVGDPIFTEAASLPRWSPDGQTLLFASSDGFWLATAPDFRPTRIADIAGPSDAVWVPGGAP